MCIFQVCSLQSTPFYGVLPYWIFMSGFFNFREEIGWATLILSEQLSENRDLVRITSIVMVQENFEDFEPNERFIG